MKQGLPFIGDQEEDLSKDTNTARKGDSRGGGGDRDGAAGSQGMPTVVNKHKRLQRDLLKL